MDTQHTPGPWLVGGLMRVDNSFDCTDGDTEIVEITTDDGEFVACVNVPNPNHTANARLIAAAPELLAALGKLLDTYENAGNRYTARERMQAIQDARAAIARAKGE